MEDLPSDLCFCARSRGRGVEGHTGPYLAFKRLFPRVLERMDLEGHAALEGLPTGLAGEWHVLGVS